MRYDEIAAAGAREMGSVGSAGAARSRRRSRHTTIVRGVTMGAVQRLEQERPSRAREAACFVSGNAR